MRRRWIYRAVCDRVVDGDTLVLRVDLGFRVSAAVTVRLRGVDAPEVGTHEGHAAKSYLADLVLHADEPVPLVVESYKDRMSFARWVADVWDGTELDRLEEAKQSTDKALLSRKLIEAGHGTPLTV